MMNERLLHASKIGLSETLKPEREKMYEMETIEIFEPFKLLDKILLPKTDFNGKEIYPLVNLSYYCKKCESKNDISIDPLNTGRPLTDLYIKKHLIDKRDLIKNGVAKPAESWQLNLGELVLFNIPALYLGLKCFNCNESYLLVFGYGEVQPSRMLLQISGIWRIESIIINLA